MSRRQFTPPPGGSVNAGASAMDSSSSSSQEFAEASRNITRSVDKLSSNIEMLAAILNASVGTALVHELESFSKTMETIVGQQMTESVRRLTHTLNTTVDKALVIAKQVDNTAKSASHDLNTTVDNGANVVFHVLSKVDGYMPQVTGMVNYTLEQADGWVSTIDSWAVKVIMAAVALTALLSSGIIAVLGCCCLQGCFRVKRKRNDKLKAHQAAHDGASPSPGSTAVHLDSLQSKKRNSVDNSSRADTHDTHDEFEITLRPHVLRTTKSLHEMVSSLSLPIAVLKGGGASPGPAKVDAPKERKSSAEAAAYVVNPRASMEHDEASLLKRTLEEGGETLDDIVIDLGGGSAAGGEATPSGEATPAVSRLWTNRLNPFSTTPRPTPDRPEAPHKE